MMIEKRCLNEEVAALKLRYGESDAKTMARVSLEKPAEKPTPAYRRREPPLWNSFL